MSDEELKAIRERIEYQDPPATWSNVNRFMVQVRDDVASLLDEIKRLKSLLGKEKLEQQKRHQKADPAKKAGAKRASR